MPKLLHVHAQEQWHDAAWIVANREALEAMVRAIQAVLTDPSQLGAVDAFCADGEGFRLHFIRDDGAEQSWQNRSLPYMDEIAARPGDGEPPWQSLPPNFAQMKPE